MFDIVKVELEDFRSFRGKHSFAFPTEPGLYAVTGKNLVNPQLGANGIGKTSLFEAIRWCNYGSTSRGLRAGDIINWGAKSCSVTVHQLIGNEDLTVTRTQSPNSLRLNGTIVDQETLEKHLRLGPEAFTYAVMIPQFGEFFFDKLPSDKLALFSQIMELDYWLEKSEEAAKLAKEVFEAKANVEREIARFTGQLETIDADVEDLKVKNKTFADAEAQRIKRLKQRIVELQANLAEIDKASEFATKTLSNLSIKLERVERGAKKCPTCGQPVKNKDLDDLLTNQSDFERQLRKLERDKVALQAEIKSLDLSPRKNPYADEITQKLAAKAKAKAKITDLKADMDALNEDHTALSFWVGGFKRVRLFIVEQALQQLELEINNSLGSLGLLDWRIELDVERENKSGGITKGFTVMVYPPDAETPVKLEAYSGGETQRLRLAGNLGLANLIMERAGLRNTIEIFDEPSSHLSEEGLLDLADTLAERALVTGRRCMIIEHNLLDYAFAGIITVVKGPDGSHVTSTP
jgi:DNA repair exonuclease SbcCD ATPase subunit